MCTRKQNPRSARECFQVGGMTKTVLRISTMFSRLFGLIWAMSVLLSEKIMKAVHSRNGSSLKRFVDVSSCFMVTLLRFGRGAIVAPGASQSKRPQKMLKIYQYEACPFCKKVREVISELDLDVLVYPTPRETLASYGYMKDSRFRPQALKIGGKNQFPLLVDENTNTVLYESEDIIKYLYSHYGEEAKENIPMKIQAFLPSFVSMGFLKTSILLRPLAHMGMIRVPSKEPKVPLELWGFEASPFVKLVREWLDCLEIPYISHSMAKSAVEKRDSFRKKHGKTLFPYIEDPNTGFKSFESDLIIKYLQKTYQTGKVPNVSFKDFNAQKSNVAAKTE